jgi:hypothetical protein
MGLLVGNVDPELLFHGHDELDQVERVGAEVVHERRLRLDLCKVHAQLLGDDLLHSFFDGHGDNLLRCMWNVSG